MAEGRCAGLLLAAGAGRRFGRPKALVELHGEPLLLRALRVLTDGGCDPLRVVLGARADEARALLPDPSIAVEAPDWESGMGASLRTGLRSLPGSVPADGAVDAVLVHLVDLPGIGAEVIARLRALASPDVVARACYDGVPGHPVLFGHCWWSEIAEGARGDRGARDWLARREDLLLVDCSDLGSGADVDTPSDLTP